MASAGIDTARLDAEVLLAEATGLDRTGLFTRALEPISVDYQTKFQDLISTRCERVPVAYITGRQEFWSLDFAVSPKVLIPRPETEHLIELAKEYFVNSEHPMSELQMCDVATGSGCIAVTLATEFPSLSLWASDYSLEALGCAATNASRHEVSSRIAFFCGDLLSAVAERSFDLVVSNPPYVTENELARSQNELAWEPQMAFDGGPEGLDLVSRLVEQCSTRLRDSGTLLMEIGSDQGDRVLDIGRRVFRESIVHKDYAGLARVFVGVL